LNRASLETIAKATKGGYVNGNNKEVLAYVKSSLDNIQKTEFDANCRFSITVSMVSRIRICFVVFGSVLLEKKTNW
jgi:Ca-activated chloride channel family protein